MKILYPHNLILLFIFELFTSGCKKEVNDAVNTDNEAFNFVITETQRQKINTSRKEQYEITDPIPVLHLAGNVYTIDRFEIRGDNTLNFTRKGYGVNMDRKLLLHNSDEQKDKKYEEYKLLAMVYDYTYIENCIAVRLFKEVDLWPVYSFFTEVRLNNHTQGLYHFIEDPVEYFIEQKNASFVVRRGYDHVVKASSISPGSQNNKEEYIARFNMIYSSLTKYSGQRLYDSLSAYIDLQQYFSKLSIDMLIKNGDYTDEVFFYTKIKETKEVFGVFPWDYDDVFADQPHEIGNSWATGTIFGHREYSSLDAVIADVGSKLLYSIEDDLDYKIAKDSLLYKQYLITLRNVIEKIDLSVIDDIFDYTYDHISPFYANDSIVAQSRYDVEETNYELFVTNLADKRQMLKERRNMILQELDIQQNQ